MTTACALRDLAALVENLDDADVSVDGVRTPDGSLVDGRTLAADLTVRLDWGSLDDVGGAVSISVPTDGETRADESGVAFPVAVEIDADDRRTETDSATGADLAEETNSAAKTAKPQVTDGGVEVTPSSDGETALPDAAGRDEADPEMETNAARDSGHEAAENPDEEGRGEDATPEPHRDPERLREAYDACDTFEEMTEALGASVTPQTVRYHAIKQGIHRPNGNTDSTPEEGADPPSAADARASELTEGDLPSGVELPTHVALDDLRDAVGEATTLYEVQRDLRMDRSAVRKLLRELDLLDLVSGRAATADDRDASGAGFDERIRRVCA